MQAMTKIAVTFTRGARKTLPFLMRQRGRLDPSGVAILDPTSAEFCSQGPSVEVLLECDESSSWAILRLDAGALAIVLEGTLGSRETSSASELTGELSPAQRALVGKIAQALAEDFVAAVKAETGQQLVAKDWYGLAGGEDRELPESDGLTVRCTFSGVEGAGIVIASSAEGLEAAVRENEIDEPAHGDPRMGDAMRDVPVDVVVELGRLTLGLREVLTLKAGDVVRLNAAVDDPVSVRVANLEKLGGVPVVSRGQLAVEIRGRHGE